MIYRALFAYPTTTRAGISGYGIYIKAPNLQAAQAQAEQRCSAAAHVESVTLATDRFQNLKAL
jgi:hypothetical protein